MAKTSQMTILELPIEELLGPLNDAERRNAPSSLFVAGDPKLARTSPKVSVIGTRSPSRKGLKRTGRLVRALVEEGAVVVSGLAAGIDTKAHESTLQCGGRTIAVLGTPLDEFYPRGNEGLQRRIMQGHLAVSEFPSGHPTQRSNFPRRNRTMALLSDASVLIEAGETSGTLHQGWEALRLNRPLFLLRSLVENPDLSWPSEMIDYGALVLSEPDEIFPHLPTGLPPSLDEIAL